MGREVCACTLAFTAIVVLGGPPRLQGPSYIFCLGAISEKVVRTLTDEAVLLLLFINLDGPGHPYCESPFSVIHLTKKVGECRGQSGHLRQDQH